jgi:hypothetical protein
LHLYHCPQPAKAATHPNTDYFNRRMRVPANERVAELGRRDFGLTHGPSNREPV